MKQNFMPLDLSLVDNQWHHEVEKDFFNKNPEGMLCLLPNHFGLRFVCDNVGPLLQQEIYERALIFAYTGCSFNYCQWPLVTLKMYFDMADRNRLLDAGDKIPGDGPFFLYRGVSGKGRKKKIRGISWTSSFKNAKFFAERFADFLENPEIYCTKLSKKYIYTYYNDRSEEEFLCNIPKHQKIKKVWPK